MAPRSNTRSNPRLMTRVLDALKQLCESKGSSARDIVGHIRQNSKTPPRNLAMQVHRALNHAVKAGLLRHRSGRFKLLFNLNPVKKEIDNKDHKIEVKPVVLNKPSTNASSPRRTQNRTKQTTRTRSRRRTRSKETIKQQRPKASKKKQSSLEVIRKRRKNSRNKRFGNAKHKSKTNVKSPSVNFAPTNRKRLKSKPNNRSYSDFSESDSERQSNRRNYKNARGSKRHRESKRSSPPKKSRARSTSRNHRPGKLNKIQQQLQLRLGHSMENIEIDNLQYSDNGEEDVNINNENIINHEPTSKDGSSVQNFNF